MIARLQQWMALTLLATVGGWGIYVWPDFHLFFIGILSIASVFIVYLAILFIATNYLNRAELQPRATPGALLRAWLAEALSTPRVFLWRQPFRSQAMPDFLPMNQQGGVVFIPGFICNRGFWTPWMTQLKSQRHAVVTAPTAPKHPANGAFQCMDAAT